MIRHHARHHPHRDTRPGRYRGTRRAPRRLMPGGDLAIRSVAAGCVGLALVAIGTAGTAFADWRLDSSATTLQVPVASMPAGNRPTAVAQASAVTISWAASTVEGVQVTGYQVRRYPADSGRRNPQGGCTVTGTTGCVEHGVPDGTWRYTVRPVQGDRWVGEESRLSAPVAVTTLTITVPADNELYRLAGLAARCGTATGDLCGTVVAEPGRTVAGVAVSVRHPAGRYWDPASGAFTASTEVPSPVGIEADGTWRLPVPAPAFTGTGRYVVKATATDSAGRTSRVKHDFVLAAPQAPKATDGPAPVTNQTAATVTFDPPHSAAETLCALDETPAVACTSPWHSQGTLADGDHRVRVWARDAAGNAGPVAEWSWVVDTVRPLAIDVQADDRGDQAGRIERGDALILRFNEQIDPASLIGGWDGRPTPVTVRVADAAAGGHDQITLLDAAGSMPYLEFGAVDLGRAGYVSRDVLIPATVRVSGDRVVVTLRAPRAADAAAIHTVGRAGAMVWTPGTAWDVAGNLLDSTVAQVTERPQGGVPDVEF